MCMLLAVIISFFFLLSWLRPCSSHSRLALQGACGHCLEWNILWLVPIPYVFGCSGQSRHYRRTAEVKTARALSV